MSIRWTRPTAALTAAIPLVLSCLYMLRRLRAMRLDRDGFLVVRKAASNPEVVAQMRTAIEAEAGKVEAGGYIIWTPADALPPPCKSWALDEAATILQRSLPPGTPAVRLLGGAALWKRAGHDQPTPFHQDFAYMSTILHPGSSTSRTTRHAAVWLALTPTGPRSGCMRFAPSLGYEMHTHQTLPRAEAPSGFETQMVGGCVSAAEEAAEDCELEPGMAVIIGDQVVHGSRACEAGEACRLAFSPLFEVDCVDCPLPAGKEASLASCLRSLWASPRILVRGVGV